MSVILSALGTGLFEKGLGTLIKDFKKVAWSPVKKSFKEMKDAFKKKGAIKGLGSMFQALGTMALSPIMGIISLLDALGIAQPIIDVLNGLISMFGGMLMELLFPAFQKLFEVLLSPEVMEILRMLAEILAAVLGPIILMFIEILKAVLPALKPVLQILGAILIPLFEFLTPIFQKIGKVLGWVMGIFGYSIIALKVVGNAFIWFINLIITAINAVMKTITFGAWKNIKKIKPISLQHGGMVTRHGIYELHPKETVIPLERVSGMNEEIIWALEENTKILNNIYTELKQANRRNRRI